jgi:hypothetical protein
VAVFLGRTMTDPSLITAKTIQVNAAVKAAQSLPDLIAKLSVANPTMADQLTSKSLITSKSLYGTPIVTAIAFLSAKYGLGWDDTTVNLVSLFVLLAASAGFRLLTKSPIGGVFTSGTSINPVVGNTVTKG